MIRSLQKSASARAKTSASLPGWGTRKPVAGNTIVPHSAIRNSRLNRFSRGLLVHMLSKPPGWTFTVKRLARHTHSSPQRVRNGLATLEAADILQRIEVRKNGKVAGFRAEWTFGRKVPFAYIPNRVIYADGLTLEALGLLALLAVPPINWVWRMDSLMRASGMGATKLRNALNLLKSLSLIRVEKVRDGGRWVGSRVEVIGVAKPHEVLPHADSPHAGFVPLKSSKKDDSNRQERHPISKKKPHSNKEQEIKDVTLSTTGKGPDGTVSKQQRSSKPKKPKPKKTKQKSPAFEVAQALPDKYRRRWMGISRNTISRGAANGISKRWPEVVRPFLDMTFANRLTAHAAALWTKDLYRDLTEHGVEKVLAALERAARSREPLATYRKALGEEPFDPVEMTPPIDNNLWKVLVLHLEEKGGRLTKQQAEMIVNNLARWVEKHGVEAVEKQVRATIERGWRQVYEPKPWNKRAAQKKKEGQTKQPDPRTYKLPASIAKHMDIEPPDNPNDEEAVYRWTAQLSDIVLYWEHYDGVSRDDAEKVKRDWGFRL